MRKFLLFFTICYLSANCSFVNAQKWAMPGTIVAGGNGLGSASNQLNSPGGSAVDKDGNVYVADYGNHRVQKWAPGATQGVTVAGGIGSSAAANGLNYPSSVWIDDDKTLYICDGFNSRIQMWTEGATTGVTVAGGNGMGNEFDQLFFPAGIFKKGNDIYIMDGGNARVLRWTLGASAGVVVAGGNGTGFASNQLATGAGTEQVFVDSEDNVYVAEYSADRVSKWAPGATVGTVAANITATGASSVRISGLAFLRDGKMLVSYSQTVASNANRNKVTMWQNGQYLGDVITTASAEVASPVSLFLTDDYSLYVTESAGGATNRVKKFNYICELTAVPLATQISVCEGSPITLTLTPNENAAEVKWYNSESSTTPIYTGKDFSPTGLTGTTTFWAQATNYPCSTAKIKYTVTVNAKPELAVEETEIAICSGAKASLFATSAGNVIFWYANETDTTYLYHGNFFTTPSLTETTEYWVEAYNLNTGCRSSRVKVTVTVSPVLSAPQAVSAQTFTPGQTLANLQVTATGTLTWYANAALTTVLPATTPLVAQTTYYVTQKNAGGCESAATSITVSPFLGVSDVSNQNFAVYPNPTASIVTIKSKVKVKDVLVINSIGQIVASLKDNTEINLAKYPNGSYLLKVTLENGEIVTKKIIKK